jgi:hypothetical protein
VTSKIIDLLLEEEAHARGIDLYAGDRARQLAWTLFNEGPRSLGPDGFDSLIATMVGFASLRNRDGSVISVDTLFDEFGKALARSYRREVTAILRALLRTRVYAEDYLRTMDSRAALMPEMEALIPCIPFIGHWWSTQIGGLSMLVDEHRVLTDEELEIIAKRAALDSSFLVLPRVSADVLTLGLCGQ